jgi:hypothetical protein
MVEVSIGAEHLFVPTQKHVAIPTVTSHTQVKSNYEEPSPKRNKVHEKLSDMISMRQRSTNMPSVVSPVISLWRPYCRMTKHTHTHTHNRSHTVVLTVHTPVLAV